MSFYCQKFLFNVLDCHYILNGESEPIGAVALAAQGIVFDHVSPIHIKTRGGHVSGSGKSSKHGNLDVLTGNGGYFLITLSVMPLGSGSVSSVCINCQHAMRSVQ